MTLTLALFGMAMAFLAGIAVGSGLMLREFEKKKVERR